MNFRKATISDFSTIWEIILFAKESRKNDGSSQWQDGYPNEETIKNDIQKGYGFVVEEDDEILAYEAIIFDPEPAYDKLQGKWLSEQPYSVVHRMAVSPKGKGRGLGNYLLEKAETVSIENQIFSLKIDTNFDNIAMLKILERRGYQYCGEVQFRGSSRKAFEKILGKQSKFNINSKILKKISFKNDYSEGCHHSILEALTRTNLEQQIGYGLDEYSIEAERIIKEKINQPKAKIHFVSGGTQANLTIISALLRPYESVISAEVGHILNNETGAIEATGHKIHSLKGINGKILVSEIKEVLDNHTNIPHQVKPKMVYISNATEVGTIYSYEELLAISQFCKENNLYLFMDGARLGHAIMAENNNLTLSEIAKLTDIFYLGGTKNGAMFGEAIIINNEKCQKNFTFSIKQKGAMLAKGRFLGIQFLELFKENLYFDLAKKANEKAMKIKTKLKNNGYDFLAETFTNQLFPILPNKKIEQLSQEFDFYIWKKIDEQHSAIRLITSWATTDEMVEQFLEKI